MKRLNPLPADNLVDMRVFVRCKRNCYPPLAVAIEQLCREWNEDPASRRGKIVFSKLAKTVDVVLLNYRAELVSRCGRRPAGSSLNFSHYLRQFGRRWTETKILSLHRLLRRSLESSPPVRHLLQDILGGTTGHNVTPASTVSPETAKMLYELLDTLDALISLTNVVTSFRPKARLVNGVNIRKQSWNNLCRFCGQLTEMQALAEQNVIRCRKDNAPQRLNPSLCRKHRTRNEKGEALSAYRSLKRNEPELQREIEALSWASVRKGPEQPGFENELLYEFRRRIVDQQNLHLYSEAELADQARCLMQHGMNDQKKLIVMMRCANERAIVIARHLGITRQAVYKAIQTVPPRYCFHDESRLR
jgi:hypothetical protein